MNLYIQYHNADKEGLRTLFSNDGRFAIYTRRPHVHKAQGTVLLIVGVGKPKRYFLWEAFEIKRVKSYGDGTFVAEGPGWRLGPPQHLEGPEFDAFQKSCANFIGFRQIDDLKYSTTLRTLAERYRRPAASKAMASFLRELLGLLKQGSDDCETVLAELSGHANGPAAVESPPTPDRAARNAVSKQPKPKSTKRPEPADPDSQPTQNLRALSIRQPHAEAIMRGIKKIEYRNMLTKIRGQVQIYTSLGRYPAEIEAEMLVEYGIEDVSCDKLPRGVLIGTVEIKDCTEDYGEFHWHLEKPKRAAQLLKPKKQPQPVWFNPF